MNYLQNKTEDKEVIAMEGIIKIEIPEIEGLRETFAASTVECGGEAGISCKPGGPG